VSFLNKAAIQYTLSNLPSESHVIIDGTDSMFIDRDVLEIIHNFRHNAFSKGTVVEILNVKEQYDVPGLKELIYKPTKIS
jgi:SulP family sulfate permease